MLVRRVMVLIYCILTCSAYFILMHTMYVRNCSSIYGHTGCTVHTCAHVHLVDTVDVRCLPQCLPILLLLYSTLVSKLAP